MRLEASNALRDLDRFKGRYQKRLGRFVKRLRTLSEASQAYASKERVTKRPKTLCDAQIKSFVTHQVGRFVLHPKNALCRDKIRLVTRK